MDADSMEWPMIQYFAGERGGFMKRKTSQRPGKVVSSKPKKEDPCMEETIVLDSVYSISKDVISRDIEGELIIVPLYTDSGRFDDELFTLNETGRAIWEKMDGKRSLKTIAGELAREFDAPVAEVGTDVMGWVKELSQRKLIAKLVKKDRT